jgi:hypothetical protein|tara:strand:+ start:750 stop:980 length:231 start_codon:yes stop_codon:yes gene_type:complete
VSNDLKIKGPVEIKDNSAERVAFDLMSLIDESENPAGLDECRAKKSSNRLYYLNLYAECIDTVKYQRIPDSDSSQE